MGQPTLELLSKTATTGDLTEILHKLVMPKGGANINDVFKSISAEFGESGDFIYSIAHSRGVKTNEGSLVLPGSNMQIIRFVIRLSGTTLWVSNEQKIKFYVSCGVDYSSENGMLCMPIGSNMMIVSLKLAAPLATMTNFRFRTLSSIGNVQLMPI